MVANEKSGPHTSTQELNIQELVEDVYSTLWTGYVIHQANTKEKRFDVQAELIAVLTLQQIQALCLHALNCQEIPEFVKLEWGTE